MNNGLEELNYLYDNVDKTQFTIDNDVEKCYNVLEDKLIVLTILKTKNVLYTQIPYCDTVDDYNHLIQFTDFDELTLEEFNAIKEEFRSEDE